MKSLIVFVSFLFFLNFTSCATRVVTQPTTITVVKKRPQHYKIVRVKGKRYYFWNGKHYRKTRNGYVFVKF